MEKSAITHGVSCGKGIDKNEDQLESKGKKPAVLDWTVRRDRRRGAAVL